MKMSLSNAPSMDKVSMSHLFSFSRYQTKCIIEFLFRQLMASWTLRFDFDHPLKQRPTSRNKGRTEIQKFEYLENEKSFLDEIKGIFHSFWRAVIWWKNKNLMTIVDTSFILNFWPKFAQKGCLRSLIEKLDITIEFWIFELL